MLEMACATDRPELAIAGRKWFALTVKPRHEKATLLALQSRGLEAFLPVHEARRKWSDRIKRLEMPLFTGYVFCRFSLDNRLPVLSTPGVNSIVSFGGTPTSIPEAEIEAVRAMVASGLPLTPWPYLKAGQDVRIKAGPLRNLEGRLASARDTWHVVVNVELLQRSVAVTVERDWIEVTCETPRRVMGAVVGLP
jgi:transcription antitermination factor NusG